MRLMLFVLLAGCSTPSDPIVCKATFAGDASAMESCSSSPILCHPTSNDYEALSVTTTSLVMHLDVDGVFTLRSYSEADLRGIDLRVDAAGKRYAAGQTLTGSSVTLNVTALTAPKANPCDGTGHGSVTAKLVEYDPTTGMASGSGRVDLALTF